MLKGRNLWVCPIANGSSWTWRKILGLRRHCHQCFHTAIGDGKDTWIWYDKWVTSELLVDMYGVRIIYDAASTKNAKVADLLSNQGWILPARMSHGLSEFRRMLQEGVQFDLQEKDRVEWNLTKDRVFTIGSAWEYLRKKCSNVNWNHVVWFNGNIPKHSFILWLVYHGKLNTKDRMMKWGIVQDDQCSLCESDHESLEHLFFKCNVSMLVWRTVAHRCGLDKEVEVYDARKVMAGNSFCMKVQKLALAATVYHVWGARNKKIFQGLNLDEAAILEEIGQDVARRNCVMAKR